MIMELVFAWLLTLPRISDSKAARFWKAENAVNAANLQCEACQAARVNRNKVIAELQQECRELPLELNQNGDPVCMIRRKQQ